MIAEAKEAIYFYNAIMERLNELRRKQLSKRNKETIEEITRYMAALKEEE